MFEVRGSVFVAVAAADADVAVAVDAGASKIHNGLEHRTYQALGPCKGVAFECWNLGDSAALVDDDA